MSICSISHLLWLSVNGGGWDCIVQRSSPHKCSQKSCCNAFNAMVATFASRYFCILIIFAYAWSPSLSLDLPRGSPKLPKYLLDWYSSYPRSINFSEYIPSSFLYVILHSEPRLIIYSSSDVSMSLNRAQGPIYQFGLLPPQFLYWHSKNNNNNNKLEFLVSPCVSWHVNLGMLWNCCNILLCPWR